MALASGSKSSRDKALEAQDLKAAEDHRQAGRTDKD